MKKKKIIVCSIIFATLVSLWIVLGIVIKNNALEFFPLSVILGFVVNGIYLSIANNDDTLVESLKKGIEFICDYFEKAAELLVSAIKGTNRSLDWLWIIGIIFTCFLSVVYGVIFLYVSVLAVVFTAVITILVTISCCVFLVYYHLINNQAKNGLLGGAISFIIIAGFFVWHVLNMVL